MDKMKKLMFAAFAAAGLTALAVDSNIVGYQTKDLASATYTMLSVPFVNVTDSTAGLQLNSDISVSGVKGDSESFLSADQIWVWVPSKKSYDKFFYYDDGEEAGWSITTGGQEYIEEVSGYEDGLPVGSAFFFLAKSGTKALTGSGAVDADDEVELALTSGTYTMIANPYPSAIQLNSDAVSVENVTGDSESFLSADQIWVWVPSKKSYDKFFYYDDGEEAGWSITTGGQEYIEEVSGYEDGIPSGSAMYFLAKSVANKSITFKSPIAE